MAEITRQLKLENVVQDRVFGSVAETLSFLLEAFRSGSSSGSRPILIVMENFDLFAAHRKQTLLYNLFDTSQSAATPLTVLGCTRRLDVLELLEKRVKSRFCHRQVHLANEWSREEFVDAFRHLATVAPDGISKNAKLVVKRWNAEVEALVRNEAVAESLQKLYAVSKEVIALVDLLVLPASRLCHGTHESLTPRDIADSYSSLVRDEPKSKLLHGLSIVELCLVIATRHLCRVHGATTGIGGSLQAATFNFHEIYNEFLKFSSRRSHLLHNCNRHVVMKAFEHLLQLEVVRPHKHSALAARARNTVTKDYVPMMLLVDTRQVDEAVANYPNCPTDVQKWAESAIM